MSLRVVQPPPAPDGTDGTENPGNSGSPTENPEAFCACYAMIVGGHHTVGEHHSKSCAWDGPCGSCWNCLEMQFVHGYPDEADRDRMLAEAIADADYLCLDTGHPVVVLDPDFGSWFCTTCQRHGLV